MTFVNQQINNKPNNNNNNKIMQRIVSKAAIQSGKKGNIDLFFESLQKITQYRDQNGVPIDHKGKLAELCRKVKERPDLNAEQLTHLASMFIYVFSETEEGVELLDKAYKMNPSSDFIKQEKILQLSFNCKFDECDELYKQLKPTINDPTISAYLAKVFLIKSKTKEFFDKFGQLISKNKPNEADKLTDDFIKSTGGVCIENLNIFRTKMDTLQMQDKIKELAEFFCVIAQQSPLQNVYYRYAADNYLTLNKKPLAIANYAKYYKYEFQDMDELQKYLDILPKNAQIKQLEQILKDKVIDPLDKQSILDLLQSLGGDTTKYPNDSDEEEYVNKFNQENQGDEEQEQQGDQQNQEEQEQPSQQQEQQAESNEEQPMKQAESKGEQPIQAESKGEQPTKQAESKGEQPTKQAESKGEQPMKQAESKGEQPMGQAESKGEQPIKQAELKGEQPIKQPESKGEQPIIAVQSEQPYNPSTQQQGQQQQLQQQQQPQLQQQSQQQQNQQQSSSPAPQKTGNENSACCTIF